MRGKERNIFAPVTQRRDADRHRVQAEQQVLAEAARPHLGVRIRVRGGDQPRVHAPGARRSDALHLAGLEHPQQLGLLRGREIGYFVEKQRATVGELEAPGAIGLGVGERPLHVAEQLTLEQSVGNPAHVHRDERAVRAGRGGVQPTRHDLLASAVLSQHQHVRIRRADALHESQHRLHGGRLGD